MCVLASSDNIRTKAYTRPLASEELAKATGGTLWGMSRIQYIHTYEHIISHENILLAWKEFLKGKKTAKRRVGF